MATALIDPEVRQFVERSESFFPQDGSNLSIDQQRALYDRLCAAFSTLRPDRLTVRDLKLVDRPARHYQPDAVRTAAHLLFFHGGGFVVGGIESHDSICAEIAVAAGMNVFALDYRLAPEHRNPAAFKDALGAYLSLRKENPVILAGDSAGGNLAAAVALAARDREQSASGQLLIYPTLGGEALAASNREEAAAPLLTSQDMRFYQEVRSDGPAARRSSPICETFTGCRRFDPTPSGNATRSWVSAGAGHESAGCRQFQANDRSAALVERGKPALVSGRFHGPVLKHTLQPANLHLRNGR